MVLNESCACWIEILLLQHLLNCFFLIFALLYCLPRCGFPLQDFLLWSTLLGWMPTWTVVPIAFSPCTYSVEICLPGLLDRFANLLAFMVSPATLNFIILLNGRRSNIILLFQLFGKRKKHDLSPNMSRCIEMLFAAGW